MSEVDRKSGRRVAIPETPLILQHSDECTGCWACVRHCPAHALRVIDSRVEVIPERCVLCGACVAECGRSGKRIRQDIPRVLQLLQGDSPVVALLSSEHVAGMHPLTPNELESALELLGFSGVETTVLGEEMVAAAYELEYDHRRVGATQLRSTCPVAVDWVRKFYPEMTEALAPIAPPYIAQARLIRELYPTEVSIVYVAPCWARKQEIYSDEFVGDIDVAIGFDELRTLIARVSVPPAPDSCPRRRPNAVKQLSVTDGFPRKVLRESDLTGAAVRVVRGLGDIDSLLTALRRGEASPAVVDMLCCEGCIDGPCVNKELSVFAKRNIDAAERERQPPPAVDSRTFLSALPKVDLHRTIRATPAPCHEPTPEEVDNVLAAGEFASREEVLDCGMCGYERCVQHATAIWLGNSTWSMCFPLERKRLLREHDRLSEASLTDDLTGLLNRRALDARLAEEIARAERYGTPLSLVVLDLDNFKEVNDQLGHAAGDALLRAVGTLLRAELRTADIAVRYGGDEFALVLPGVTKTGAWAVAEKVIGSLRLMSADNGDGPRVSSTCSVGVASFGETFTNAEALLRGADAALYAAKRSGRNRVELAAG